jgi:inosine-uridine nucleoside N-ribohydrolase
MSFHERPLIIVTDAARQSDDAVAISMLLGAPRFDIRLIVTTSGNVWAEEAAGIVQKLLTQFHRDEIGVCVGTSSSAFEDRWNLYKSNTDALSISKYMGAFSREPPKAIKDFHECTNLFEVIVASSRPDLLVIGPASPIFSLLKAHAELAEYLGQVFLMGGAIECEGNATPAAEFNFWFDPDAAEALLASNLQITLLPLDAIRALHYSREFAAALDPTHPMQGYIKNASQNPNSLSACDEVLAAVMLDSALVSKSKSVKLSVDANFGPNYGAVSVLEETASRRPVKVITEIDSASFWQLAQRALSRRQ